MVKKNFIDEIKDLRRYFSKENVKDREITFYSEAPVYYRYFEGYIDYILNNSSRNICYVSSNPEDTIFSNKNPRIKTFYSFLLFPALIMNSDAKAFIMTMDDLNQFSIKRAFNPRVEHIYAMHTMSSTTMAHRKGAFDHYDTIFCVGNYQKEEIIAREKKYNLKTKKLIEIGYPHLDNVARNRQEYLKTSSIKDDTILIAPSWHDGNIFETCITQLVKTLLKDGYKVIVRPHNEHIKRNKKLILNSVKEFENDANFTLELDLKCSESIQTSALLITDWSGILFEWALASERPILFINTKMKSPNPDYADLGIVPVEIQIRDLFGKNLNLDEIEKANEYAKELLEKKEDYVEKITDYRNKNVYNWLTSANAGGEYILSRVN